MFMNENYNVHVLSIDSFSLMCFTWTFFAIYCSYIKYMKNFLYEGANIEVGWG